MQVFADGIWIDTEPVSIMGTHLTATMSVLKLTNGSTLLYSPIPMTDQRLAAVRDIGAVEHLYAPNLFHHYWIGEWQAQFPNAKVHAPFGLQKKRPDLHIDRIHNQAGSPLALKGITELTIEGLRLEESILLYQPTRTLLIADLVHNIGQPSHRWTRIYSSIMGFYDRVALSRVIRWTAFSNAKKARQSLDKLLDLDFDQVIPGHGAPIESAGKDAVRQAFAWLSVKSAGHQPARL